MPEQKLPLTSTHWGAYRVKVEDERVTALLPFEEDPDPSPIGQGIVSAMQDDTRILHPMVRESWLRDGPGARTDLRGKEPFVQVSWKQAESFVAAELDRVRRGFGNQAIYGGSYGWASAGRFHHAQSQIHRFLNCIGGYTKSVNTYSFAAAEVAVPHILGDYRKFLNTTTSWDSVAEHAELLVAFGGIPLKNGQIDNGGIGRHIQRAGLMEAVRANVRIVNVSPDRSAIAPQARADWMAIRPCTDTAMLLAIGHELLRIDRVDHAFLERYTVGSDRVFAYLQGQDDGIAKSPEWAAEICGVDAEEIRALARDMATKRTMISVSWSLTRQRFGEQPYWAAISVAAMLGQIGQPGTGFAFGYSATNGIGARRQHLPYASLPQGENPVKDFIPVARIADMLLHPNETYRFNGETKQYPEIKLVYWAGGNPFHHHQDLNRLRRAWQRPDTIITQDWCWTATANHSDIVLPCTNHLERSDLALSPRDAYVVAMEQAVAPAGEARNDYDILSGIADRMGLGQAFTEGRSAEDWQRWIYHSSQQRLSEVGLSLPSLETLRAQGWAKVEMPDKPTIMLQEFVADPNANALKTPSGKIELFSETVSAFGDADCPGYAWWRAPDEWLGNRKDDSWLHLLCVQPQNKLHSQLDQGSVCKGDKIRGLEPIQVSPSDATRLDIEDGMRVEVHNSRGAILACVVVNPDIRAGVLRINTGAWFDPDANGRCLGGNPNVLTPDVGTSALGQGPSAHSCLVQIRPFQDDATPPLALSTQQK
ncbi:molybdopterin-dependent oxidoreductase [Shimia sediminis]|uniref:molybdopterin-dependent oxidoreductase n=1 Tax=Shimia sediminis TaxID=2497945 RepID=UPI000F8D4492|nr:molybdopterin-dependent oxidoreductase [Shimia sediminis]